MDYTGYLLRTAFLLQRAFAQKRRLGRMAHHQRARGEKAPDRAQAIGRRQRPKPSRILGNHLCVTRKLDGCE